MPSLGLPTPRRIYFATRDPWTKEQKDDYRKKWKDVVQYRTAERGDTIFAFDVSAALAKLRLPRRPRQEQKLKRIGCTTPELMRSRNRLFALTSF